MKSLNSPHGSTRWALGLMLSASILAIVPLLAQSAGDGTSTGGNFSLVTKLKLADPSPQSGGSFTLRTEINPPIVLLQMPGAPSLRLRYLATSAIISWASTPSSFTLQTTPTPHLPATWQPVAGSPEFLNGTNNFTVPVTTTRQFYRLKSP